MKDADFERTLTDRLNDLAGDVAPQDGLLERSRAQARRAAIAHNVRRYAVPAAAAVVVVAAIGALLVSANRDKETTTRPVDAPTTTTTTKPTTTTGVSTTSTTAPAPPVAPPDPFAGLPDVDVVITPEQRTQGDLTYHVPTFAVTIDGGHSDAAQAIEADLQSTADDMATHALSFQDFPIAELDVSAALVGVSDRTVSVRLEAYVYYEGGAHGGRLPKARTYEISTGRPRTLDELFKQGSDFLGVMATVARERVAVMTDGGVITESAIEGTEPLPENYEVWAILPEGLEVTFHEYQVGPYAIGQPAVIIPWYRLADLLGDWRPGGIAAPWSGGLAPSPGDVATVQQVADREFATTTELRSVRRWSYYPGYVVALVVTANHTISPIAVRMDDPPTVVALGSDRFGCDTLPAEAVAQLFLPC